MKNIIRLLLYHIADTKNQKGKLFMQLSWSWVLTTCFEFVWVHDAFCIMCFALFGL